MNRQARSVRSAVAASILHRGDNAALWTRGQTYSYRRLGEVAAGIKKLLVINGIDPQSRIGVVTGDDLHTYASLLAIWSLNCAYVPLNAHNPPSRNSKIIESAEPAAILASQNSETLKKCLPEHTSGTEIIDSTTAPDSDGQLSFPDALPDDLAYLFFTSGSTGAPKGVPISHGNLDAFMEVCMNHMGYDFSPEDRFLQMFEMTFDLSVVSIFAPWYCGACCCVVPDEGIAYMNILNVLMEQEVSVAVMVPSVLGYLQRFFPEVSLPNMRLNLFCGEAFTQEMAQQWSDCLPNARIENVYGPTEATIWCTAYPWNEQQSSAEAFNGIVSIGRPVPGSGAVVVDESGMVCAAGEKGELVLSGPQVMDGYWKDTKKTGEVMIEVSVEGQREKAYRSGDIAFVNEYGNLIYCGRLDSQVKIDGHRVELGEIEHCARICIGNSMAAVILRREADGQNSLHLFVAGDRIDAKALMQRLENELPSYMRPGDIHVLRVLPVNLNGKIDRLTLANMLNN